MKKIFFIAAALFYSLASTSQILVTDPDLDAASPMDCAANAGPTANFFDSGNNSANYSPNENETITICPDFAGGTSKLSLSFGINTGWLFDVDASDTVYIYDGANTSAPLLGAYNSSNAPTGFTHSASFANPTGCLTIQFVSDGAIEGTGWDANVTCVSTPQPFEVHMAGYKMGIGSDVINPSDTGYADVCFGDSVLYVATGIFPYSSDVTGVGYSQNPTNVTYEWEFSNGAQATGDSVWFTPPARSGYLVTLKMTDQFPQSQQILSKIRVSTIPSFSGVLNGRDSVCTGDTTLIIGGVTATDTAGVDPNDANFQLGGSFAGLTWLPDGSGLNYTTSVNISGFGATDTISSVSDVQDLNITMEHSYLGDLEMLLECPNGTQVVIFNSNSAGIIPGGFSGGGTYLGDATDGTLGTPGVGWEYKWSSTNATWGDFPTEFAGGNTIMSTIAPAGPSMNPNGVYLPEQSFAGFIGCPINGAWTITVRDNLAQDDGYIFEWGIFFDPAINPNSEVYAPSITNSQWLSSSTILPGNPTDTFIVVTSNVPGTYDYTFEVTDNFGCIYDTTVQVYFLPGPTVQNDSVACAGQYQIINTTAYSGGVWSYVAPQGGTATFSPNNTSLNPLVDVDVNGTYTFTYTDNQCLLANSFDIYFADSVDVNITGGDVCLGDEIIMDATSQVLGTTYLWNTGSTDASIIATNAGTYSVVVTGSCNTVSDNAVLITEICGVTAPNVITPNGDGLNDILFFTGLDRFPTSKLEVFNRWGLVVYSNENYRNDWSPVNLSDGTYFYVLTPEGSGGIPQDPLKGSISVFK